jgi:hypothetical protein
VEAVLGFFQAWVSPVFRATALKVAMVVGSVLFVVNHGAALIEGEMSTERWLGAAVTYFVPYTVSVHGQFVAKSRQEVEKDGNGAKIYLGQKKMIPMVEVVQQQDT